MSNKRTKAVLANDDEFDYDEPSDEYEEEGGGETEISEEDEQHLILGTIQVRQQLESGIQVTDQEIRDALWNYYYDVPKTLLLIRSKLDSVLSSISFTQLTCLPDKYKPKPKPQAQISHSASKSSDLPHVPPLPVVSCVHKTEIEITSLIPRLPAHDRSSFSARDFFADCPWLHIPTDRQALLTQVLDNRPRGLLGGSSAEPKMSKVAALAAKRRQKELANAVPATDAPTTSQNDYTASLKKLTIGDSAIKEQRRRQELERNAVFQRQQDEARRDQLATPVKSDVELQGDTDDVVVQRLCRPSVFASTFVSASISNTDNKLDPTSFAGSSTDFDFSKPSPDAIVHKAQTGRTF